MAECMAPAMRPIKTDGDAFEWAADLAEAFIKCKAKHDGLRGSIKEFNHDGSQDK